MISKLNITILIALVLIHVLVNAGCAKPPHIATNDGPAVLKKPIPRPAVEDENIANEVISIEGSTLKGARPLGKVSGEILQDLEKNLPFSISSAAIRPEGSKNRNGLITQLGLSNNELDKVKYVTRTNVVFSGSMALPSDPRAVKKIIALNLVFYGLRIYDPFSSKAKFRENKTPTAEKQALCWIEAQTCSGEVPQDQTLTITKVLNNKFSKIALPRFYRQINHSKLENGIIRERENFNESVSTNLIELFGPKVRKKKKETETTQQELIDWIYKNSKEIPSSKKDIASDRRSLTLVMGENIYADSGYVEIVAELDLEKIKNNPNFPKPVSKEFREEIRRNIEDENEGIVPEKEADDAEIALDGVKNETDEELNPVTN